MEWNKENTIELIEVYKKYHILWDPKHRDHYNKFRKQDAWEEIAKQIGRSVDDCKKKMDYLLTALRREKMKMKKSTGIGKVADEVYKSSWFAFDSMMFLWEKNKPKSPLNTLPKASIQEETAMEVTEGKETSVSLETSWNETSEVNSNMPTAAKCLVTSAPIGSSKRKKLKALKEQCLHKAFKVLQNTSEKDDCYHFGNLVASKLRMYDEIARCGIEGDILNIFARASAGYYNRVTVMPSFIMEESHSSYSVSSAFSDSPNSQPQQQIKSNSSPVPKSFPKPRSP
ncbi:hypothetical protein J437_LFUL011554 [Ladona fulva]|uniref:MADF domain-containing protein n=1 Tax=Ladona fulva TaxID=123851 RepID=A0A8K0P2S7_LADFU|nr:hypothetical protein J437_LFUL011554 [Ladona fulva]